MQKALLPLLLSLAFLPQLWAIGTAQMMAAEISHLGNMGASLQTLQQAHDAYKEVTTSTNRKALKVLPSKTPGTTKQPQPRISIKDAFDAYFSSLVMIGSGFVFLVGLVLGIMCRMEW